MIRSLVRLIDSFSKKLSSDNVSAFSTQAAFFLIISFFPFAMFLLTLLNYLPFSKPELLAAIESVFPQTVSVYLSDILDELLEKSNGTVLSLTAIATLWTSSKGFYAVVRGLDAIYRSTGKRSYILTRILAALYTLLFAVLVVAVLFFFVFGNQIYLFCLKHIPILSEMALLIISVRTLVGFCLMILFFTLVFITMPNRKSSFFAELPGAILASAGWIGFSYLFSFYIDNFSNYSATYGSLTAVVLCMLWFYSCMYIMFIGAEINQVLANPVIREAFRTLITTRRERRKKKNGRISQNSKSDSP